MLAKRLVGLAGELAELKREASPGSRTRAVRMTERELAALGGRRQQLQSALAATDQLLGSAIRAALAAGVSIADVARLSGLSRPTVYRMMAGDDEHSRRF